MSDPSSQPRQPFQTDVRRTRGLQGAHISLLGPSSSSSQPRNAAVTGPRDAREAQEAATGRLKDEEERLNKRIDEYIHTLENGMAEFLTGFGVADKSTSRLEQEAFMYEYRCDTIVKSVQGLSGLSKALQLSLLLSQGSQQEQGWERKAGVSSGSKDDGSGIGNETERERLQREVRELQAKAGGLVTMMLGQRKRQDDGVVAMDDPPAMSDDDEEEEDDESLHPQTVGLVDQLIGAAINQQKIQMEGAEAQVAALLDLPPFEAEPLPVSLQLPLESHLTSQDGFSSLAAASHPFKNGLAAQEADSGNAIQIIDDDDDDDMENVF